VEVPQLPLLRVDATLAEQAIGNIVANAALHTPADSHIAVEALAEPGAIVVRVTDDGPGIPSDRLPHIFEKFVKGHDGGPTRADGGQGTGLGLAIAKGIMEAHGGTVTAQSPVANGRGARFVLSFPLEGTPA
jgi:two-component system sensor histidine kinase KdpD